MSSARAMWRCLFKAEYVAFVPAFGKESSPNFSVRHLSTSAVQYLREVKYTEEQNKIIIEGIKVKSDRTGNVVTIPGRKGCSLCRLGIHHLKHTDVLILNQFLESSGKIIPREITGLCAKQHRNVFRAVVLARKAGLLPKPPGTPLFGDWEKYNTYFKKF